jgi:hypothetical protein
MIRVTRRPDFAGIVPIYGGASRRPQAPLSGLANVPIQFDTNLLKKFHESIINTNSSTAETVLALHIKTTVYKLFKYFNMRRHRETSIIYIVILWMWNIKQF